MTSKSTVRAVNYRRLSNLSSMGTMNHALAILGTIGLILSVLTAGMISSSEDGSADSLLPTFEDQHHLQSYLSDIDPARFSSQGGLIATESDEGVGYSGTNVQVAGVDEMDVVKTDGVHVFIVSDSGILIIKAYPPEELMNLSYINASSLWQGDDCTVMIRGIFIQEDRMAVISILYLLQVMGNQSFPDYETLTLVSILDISEPREPILLGSHGVSGYPIASRMMGGIIYAIAQDWIPEDDPGVLVIENGDTVTMEASQIRYDPEAEPGCFVNILSVSMEDLSSEEFSVLAQDTSIVYMSTSSIYLTFTKWFGLGWEEMNAVMTTVYRLSVTGLHVEPVARGEMAGWPLNQFALDERDGYLRAVTTVEGFVTHNCVYVMDSSLTIVGSISEVAPGETVYSARFLDELLYLVTFERVDPLFVIDLGIPTQPRILGALHVPGFSSYLHPLGDGHLLGIGMENSSVKLSLFNVTDPQQPQESDRLLIGDFSCSEALWDHKAVFVDQELELLAIPIAFQDEMQWRNGIMVFNISVQEGIESLGFVDMGDSWGPLRSIRIGDLLYTISPSMVLISSIDDLSQVNLLIYQLQSGYWSDQYPYAASDGDDRGSPWDPAFL